MSRSAERLERARIETDSAERKAKRIRESALEYADRRKWADKKYGDERRAGPPPPREQ